MITVKKKKHKEYVPQTYNDFMVAFKSGFYVRWMY